MRCNDIGVEQSERRKKDVPNVRSTRYRRVRWWRYLYTADRKTPTLRRSRGATGTGPPLVLRLFRAASNHHESPFRIGAEPRGTTNARGGFSSGCRRFFFLGNLIGRYRAGAHYTVLMDPRREFISVERIISSLPQGLSATDRFSAGWGVSQFRYLGSSIALVFPHIMRIMRITCTL